jgi:hypothetical protein
MVRGIVIPAVNSHSLENCELDGLQQYQEAVGGYIEPITIAEPDLVIYVNEDGKSRRMDLNQRATVLWWLLAPYARGQDLIVAEALVVPEGDCESEYLSQLL